MLDSRSISGCSMRRRRIMTVYTTIVPFICQSVPKSRRPNVKCHNRTLQTNPWHNEEEIQNTNSHTKQEDNCHNESKAAKSLFLSEIFTKIEKKLSTQGRGGGTLIFSYIRRLGPFLGVQTFEFQYFFGFSEK